MSAAAVFAPELPHVPAVAWARTPRRIDLLVGKGLTLGEKLIWHQTNIGIQLNLDITVPWLARMSEASEWFVSQALGKLVSLKLLVAEPRPGKSTIYRLPFDYLGPKPATPQQNPGGTPQQNPGGPETCINNARTSEENTETAQSSAVPIVRDCAQPEAAGADDAGVPDRVEVLEQAVSPEAGEVIMPHVAYQLARQYPLERIQDGIGWAYCTAVKWRGSRPPRLAGLIVTGIRNGYAPDPRRKQPTQQPTEPAKTELFNKPPDADAWTGQSTIRQCARCRGQIEEFESGQVSWCKCGADQPPGNHKACG